LVVSGNSFSDPDAGVFVNVTSADYYGAGFTYPDDFIVNSENPGDNELDVTFAAPTLAFGLDYGAFAGGGSGTFTLSNSATYTDNDLPSLGATSFVGFVSSDPITGFSFVVSNDAWIVEDVVLAQTPEPRSWSLLLIALCAGVPLALRHNRCTWRAIDGSIPLASKF
jgi:hypothetical protein